MKKNTHPNWNSDASFKVNGKEVAKVGSTRDEVNVVIWSGNHPYYTGEDTFVDEDNRVEEFNEKVAQAKKKRKSARNKAERRRTRRQKRRTTGSSSDTSLKDMLKGLN